MKVSTIGSLNLVLCLKKEEERRRKWLFQNKIAQLRKRNKGRSNLLKSPLPYLAVLQDDKNIFSSSP